MTGFWDTAVVAAVIGAVAGWFVPRLVARIPEPEPEPVAASEPAPASESEAGPRVVDGLEVADNEAEFARPVDEPKELYADVAALPGLAWRCAVGCAVAAAGLGARVGWHPVLALLLFLVPVCAALSVVDWRTRYLPTWLIVRGYVGAVVLAVLASALTGAWNALVVAGVGAVVTFALFFALWFVYPRGLGYGDVRLSGLLALTLGWLGPSPLVIGIYTGFLLGGLGGLVLNAIRLFHRRHYPFGPFMVLGAWLGVVFTAPIGAAYGWVINGLVGLVG